MNRKGDVYLTRKEVVLKTIKFQTPERLAYDLYGDYGSDIYLRWLDPPADGVFSNITDEWGVVWKNIGGSHIGQPVEHPINDWKDLANLKIPDVTERHRWQHYEDLESKAGDRFSCIWGISMFERVKSLRGIENAWTDPILYPDELRHLLNILVDMNIKQIAICKEYGIDGYFIGDDWGLQERLFLSPATFREFWLPCYARVFKEAHDAGMVTLMHSCGYIVEIMDDLIDAGLDVINMDQQENMGLELLGKRFGGRITFYCPVDIQKTMNSSLDDIRAYCRKMIKHLWRPEGGFIAKWYTDPKGAGHSQEALNVMCEEFLKINEEIYGKQ